MAISEFKDVNWGAEGVSADKLNVMAANSRYLFERMPKMYYNAYGVQKEAGVKIACGILVVPASTAPVQTLNVYFGSFFTPGCKPVITHGVTSWVNGRLIPSMFGLSGPQYSPDHRGFTARIAATELHDKNYVWKTAYLNWMAMGY